MRILPQDLGAHLRKGLQAIYGVFGEEPLQQQESLDQIRLRALEAGYTARSVYTIQTTFKPADLLNRLRTQDMFAAKQLLEYHLPDTTPTALQRDFYSQLLAHCDHTQRIMILSSPKLDAALQNSAWFKKLESLGLLIPCRHLSPEQHRRWLQERLSAAGFHASQAILDCFLSRTEGNLLAAHQAIQKLRLCGRGPTLTQAAIDEVLEPSARFKIFGLLDAALSGTPAKTLQILSHLKQEGQNDPSRIVWMLTQEMMKLIPLAYQAQTQALGTAALAAAGIWQNRQVLIRSFFARHSLRTLQALFLELKSVDDIIKGRRLGNPWSALSALCLNIAGSGVCPA